MVKVNSGNSPLNSTHSPLLNLRQTQEFRNRCYSILKMISLIGGASIFLGFPLFLLLGWLVSPSWWLMFFPTGLWLLVAVIVYFTVRPANLASLKWGSYSLLLAGLLAITGVQYLTGSLNTTLLAYVAVALIATMVGLSIREIIFFSALFAMAASAMILSEKVFGFFTPLINLDGLPGVQVFILLVELGVIMGEVISLVQSMYLALAKTEQRAQQLLVAGQALTENSQVGSEVSLSLSSLVTELNATSSQQASGAQEQAAAVTQVTQSLNELAETARQIAFNSSQVAEAAGSGLKRAEEVNQTSQRALLTAERGQLALDASMKSVEEVRNGITELAERLVKLSQSSKQIQSIITMIKEISDATHLLALNAAIESAGSGQQSQRFSVVAAEVKSLADHSLEATEEVATLITDLQGAVATAVLASEETRKKTYGTVDRSYQAWQVIEELKQVVEETSQRAREIVEVMQTMTSLSEEIKYATQQQESASQQVIGAMDNVGTVAQQTAGAIIQLSSTVNQVDALANQLENILNRNQGMDLVASLN